jgi:hypothetical protein
LKKAGLKLKSAYVLILLGLTVGACSDKKGSSLPDSGAPATKGPSTSAQASGSSEGGWESSGGGGVACFKSVEDAQAAKQALASTGVLSKQLRTKIQSVVTLDTWDNIEADDHFAKQGMMVLPSIKYSSGEPLVFSPDLLKIKDDKKIVETILNSLSLSAPLFAERLLTLKERFPVETWKPSIEVPLVKDSTPRKVIAETCVLIQLANRYTISKKNEVPETKIVFDQEIFEKFLSPIDRAVLIMHEFLYLLAKEGGHGNSDFIRRLNILFFALDYQEKATPYQINLDANLMRRQLDLPFGDYMRFFLEDDELRPTESAPGSQESRYFSLISLMKKLRAGMKMCLDEKGYDKAADKEKWKMVRDCQAANIERKSAAKASFTEEEAFLFLARFVFDRVANKYNSELLSSRKLKIPSTEPDALQTQMQFYCNQMIDKPAIGFLDVQEKAKMYCQNTLKIPMSFLNPKRLEHKLECSAHMIRYGMPDQKYAVLWIEGMEGSREIKMYNGIELLTSDYTGRFEIISEEPFGESKELGFGNRLSKAKVRLKIGDDNVLLFQRFLTVSPEVLESVNVGKYPTMDHPNYEPKILTGASARKAIATYAKENVIIESIILSFSSCEVFDTNLPYSIHDLKFSVPGLIGSMGIDQN